MNLPPDSGSADPMMQHRAKYQRGRQRRAIAVVIGTVSLVAVVAVVAALLTLPGDDPSGGGGDDGGAAHSSESESHAADYPSEGDYVVTHVESGMCLTSGPEPGNKKRNVTVLGDCQNPYPKAMTFQPLDGRVYTVGLDFTKSDWQACWTVDDPADGDGYLTAGQDCGGKHRQRQEIELTVNADGAAVMSLPQTGYCLGPFQYKAQAGQAVATVDCDEHKSRQLFELTPV